MDNLIRLGTALAEIKAHKERIGTDNDFYRLAHDHIIRIISNLEPVEIEETYVKGYRVKDLVIIAERLRKDNIDPIVLKANNEAFMEGYKICSEEFKANLEKSVKKIVGDKFI